MGIDLVIPDMSYIVKNKEKVKGIVLTHGTRITSVPFLYIEGNNVPIYGTKLTLGLWKTSLRSMACASRQI